MQNKYKQKVRFVFVEIKNELLCMLRGVRFRTHVFVCHESGRGGGNEKWTS